MTRDTSIEAYNEIESKGLLSKARFEVYNALYRHGPCTAGELYKHMNWAIKGSVCARLTELREMGCATELEPRECSFSHQTAIVWDVTSALPKKLVKKTETKKSDIVNLLVSAYSELNWCHDSLFKQILQGRQLSKSGRNWLKKVGVLLTQIEQKVNVKRAS